MNEFELRTPVAFIIFNRPEPTRRIFARIREVKPERLLVIADGPRPSQKGEAENCAATRTLIESGIDWPCDVRRNYAEVNMGCRRRVASGLSWVFEQVEEAIIVEDDCLPNPTFFRYCRELLERFRDDTRIMSISGDNFQFGRRRTEESYYFSRFPHIWGWASWRRAWQFYDLDMKLWPRLRDGGWLADILGDRRAVAYWTQIFQATYEGRIDTWDYQWLLAVWANSGLAILPNENLVTNIGFEANSTHTRGRTRQANVPSIAMRFPMKHPPCIIRDRGADERVQKQYYPPHLGKRILGKLQQMVRRNS
jgi:hypothetical protein